MVQVSSEVFRTSISSLNSVQHPYPPSKISPPSCPDLRICAAGRHLEAKNVEVEPSSSLPADCRPLLASAFACRRPGVSRLLTILSEVPADSRRMPSDSARTYLEYLKCHSHNNVSIFSPWSLTERPGKTSQIFPISSWCTGWRTSGFHQFNSIILIPYRSYHISSLWSTFLTSNCFEYVVDKYGVAIFCVIC